MPGYIYLVYVSLGDFNAYKIGRCVQDPHNHIYRLKSYPKSSKICLSLAVDSDSVNQIEKECIDAFMKKFSLVHGKEYFEGNESEMILAITNILNSYYSKGTHEFQSEYVSEDNIPINECKRCHFATSQPSMLKRHLLRKYQCHPEFSDISCQDLLDELNKQIQDKKTFKCRFCESWFSSRPSRCVHEKSHKDPSKIAEELVKMKHALQTLTKPQDQNGSNNIQINNFLKENDEYILNDRPFIHQCVQRMDKGLVELAEKIHFDPNRPENNNLRITNKKQPYIQYFNGNKWMHGKKDKVLNEVIDKSYGIMQDHFEDHEDEIRTTSGALYRNIKEWMERMSEKDKKTVVPLLDDLYLLIVNGGV